MTVFLNTRHLVVEYLSNDLFVQAVNIEQAKQINAIQRVEKLEIGNTYNS